MEITLRVRSIDVAIENDTSKYFLCRYVLNRSGYVHRGVIQEFTRRLNQMNLRAGIGREKEKRKGTVTDRSDREARVRRYASVGCHTKAATGITHHR